MLLSCKHDGIVGYHDFFLDTDGDENIVICLVMEFCDGGDLWEKIAAARRAPVAEPPPWRAGCCSWCRRCGTCTRGASCTVTSSPRTSSSPRRARSSSSAIVRDRSRGHVGRRREDAGGHPDYMAPEVLEGGRTRRGGRVLARRHPDAMCASFPKMLAMYLGQGKQLGGRRRPSRWPHGGSWSRRWWRDEARRPSLMDWRARRLVARSAHLEGVSPQQSSPHPCQCRSRTRRRAAAARGHGRAEGQVGWRHRLSRWRQTRAAASSSSSGRPAARVDGYRARQRSTPLQDATGDPHLSSPSPKRRRVGSTASRRYWRRRATSRSRLTTLDAHTWYEFKVVAHNAEGESPASPPRSQSRRLDRRRRPTRRRPTRRRPTRLTRAEWSAAPS